MVSLISRGLFTSVFLSLALLFAISASADTGRPFVSQTKLTPTTQTLSFKISKPSISRKYTLDNIQLKGCWVSEGVKSISVTDAKKKSVRFRPNKTKSALVLSKASLLSYPLKAKVTYTTLRDVVLKGSAMQATGITKCVKVNGKLPKNCTAGLVSTIFTSFDGVACTQPTDFQENSSAGVIVLANGDENETRATASPLSFVMTGETFLADITDASVSINDDTFSGASLSLVGNILTVTGATLKDGLNSVKVNALDSKGKQTSADFSIWAGNNSLVVNLVDLANAPVLGGQIKLTLAEDAAVGQTISTTTGTATFTNLPSTTIAISVIGNDGSKGFAATTGNGGTVAVKLIAFVAESTVTNNSFDLGSDGWTNSSTPVTVIPHVEGDPAAVTPLTAAAKFQTAADQGQDNDLVLRTSGQGMQYVTRSFRTQPSTRTVKVRYRFQTSEYPGGYFGTRYNDYYNVSMRSSSGAKIIDDGSSMNALGRGAFTPSGYTIWRSAVIPVNRTTTTKPAPAPDLVQVIMAVANVGDAAYDSQVIVDKVEESTFSITEAAMLDIDNTDLKYISGADHPYFGKFTYVNGTITLEGEKGDAVKELLLDFLDGTTVVTSAKLSTQAAKLLLKKFDKTGKIVLNKPMLLFKIFPNDTKLLTNSSDTTYTMRIRATSAKGKTAEFSAGSVSLLVKYNGASRYDGRDEEVGGDDWVLPSTLAVVNNMAGLTFGDFSNMNGGRFDHHNLHTDGRSADAWLPGYNALNADTAASLIALLETPAGGISLECTCDLIEATEAHFTEQSEKRCSVTDDQLKV